MEVARQSKGGGGVGSSACHCSGFMAASWQEAIVVDFERKFGRAWQQLNSYGNNQLLLHEGGQQKDELIDGQTQSCTGWRHHTSQHVM
jgi:hypothetical protein